MRHVLQLLFHCHNDVGVIVTVACCPPRRHCVNQFTSVIQDDPRACRSGGSQRRSGCLHLRVGQPEVGCLHLSHALFCWAGGIQGRRSYTQLFKQILIYALLGITGCQQCISIENRIRPSEETERLARWI